ncbi:MAG: polysaccharide deacetylase family protein [Anaerolineae bacterium]
MADSKRRYPSTNTVALLAFAGMLLLAAAGGVYAVTPAGPLDQRPRAAALFAAATPRASATPTLTPFPTGTITPTVTPEPTATPVPSQTPIPPTPTPLFTPDGREREVVVPILMYHYVSVPPADADVYRLDLSVRPDEFRAQMQWLADNGYETISLYDLAYRLATGKPDLPEKPVILTFDDGYVDNYENAFPILEEFGFDAAFFILTDVTDDNQAAYMTWDMLAEMKAAGHDIEVHGRNHLQEMSDKDADWLFYHLVGPAETIEATLGHRPRFVAYISGRYDDLVLEKMAEFEYWGGLTTANGSLHTSETLYELKRVRVRGDWTLSTFISVVSDASY